MSGNWSERREQKLSVLGTPPGWKLERKARLTLWVDSGGFGAECQEDGSL